MKKMKILKIYRFFYYCINLLYLFNTPGNKKTKANEN